MDMILNADVPVSPLTIENAAMAENNEIVIDERDRKVYIHFNGEFYNITECVDAIMAEMVDTFKTNQEMMTDIFKSEVASSAIGEVVVRLTNGETTTLKEALDTTNVRVSELSETMRTNFDELNTTIENLKNSGVSEERTAYWDAKASVFNAELDISNEGWTANGEDGGPPYILIASCPQVKSADHPMIDVVLSDNYETAVSQMNNWALIYKATATDGYIIFKAAAPLEEAIHVQIKIDRVEPPIINSEDPKEES